MKKNFVLLSCFLILSCKTQKKAEVVESTPACINKAIEIFSKSGCEKGMNVKEYTFQRKQVYVFDQGNCGNDMTSEVLDNSCKNLGFLGGFTGNVKINGEDFSNAVFVKTIWEN